MNCCIRRQALPALLVLLLAAAPSAAQGRAPCTPAGKNLYVRDVMTDIYYWYQAIPDLDPTDFDSPEEYLDAIRYRPLDTSFSYITSRAANEAFFSESQYIGFGFSYTITAAREMRIRQAFPDSPASGAGLLRGDRILEINGRPVADLLATGQIDSAFGASEIGVRADVVFSRGSERVRATLTKQVVTIPTVSATRVFHVGSRTVGYVFFNNFVEPSIAALDAAFAELRAHGVNELVLDVRYNGGGLVNVARHLASLIGGVRTEGQVFAEYFHNDKNASLNHVVRFESAPFPLALDRAVVITTRSSASASELVINALRPFIPVLIVGDRTFGKPVGQYAINVCDKVLAPVSFTLRNANREGDFFDGLQPSCAAPDDLDHAIGDGAEASLSEALSLISTGRCSAASAQTWRLQMELLSLPAADGWRALIGAY